MMGLIFRPSMWCQSNTYVHKKTALYSWIIHYSNAPPNLWEPSRLPDKQYDSNFAFSYVVTPQ